MTNSNGTCIFIKGKVFNLPRRGQVKNVSIERFLILFFNCDLFNRVYVINHNMRRGCIWLIKLKDNMMRKEQV